MNVDKFGPALISKRFLEFKPRRQCLRRCMCVSANISVPNNLVLLIYIGCAKLGRT